MVQGVKGHNGHGLGVGGIPPGINKKIENGTISEKMMNKFPQLGQLLSGQTKTPETAATSPTAAAQTNQTAQTNPINTQILPNGIMSAEALRQMIDAPYPVVPPIESLNPGVDAAGLPTLQYLA